MNDLKNRFFRNPSQDVLFANGEILRMMFPYIGSFALSLLVGMLDTVMVSSVGDAAVSGVSLVDNVVQLLVFVFMAFGAGGAIVCGQYLGSEERENAKRCAEQLLGISFLAALFLTVGLIAGRKGIVGAFFGRIEEDVRQESGIYLAITAFSVPAMALYEAGLANIRALGRSGSMLRISLIMNSINVIGNALLIYGFGMGTAGAAWPTLVSRWAGALLALQFLRKEGNVFRISPSGFFAFQKEMVSRIIRVGLPNGVENGVFQLGKLLVIRIVAIFGTHAIAANAVAVILTNVLSLPGWGADSTATTVIARCVGRRDYEQARYYTRFLSVAAEGLFVLWCGLICLLLPFVLGIFHNLSPEAVSLARRMTYVHAVGDILFFVFSFTLPAALRAAGDVYYPLWISIFSMWGFRVLGGWLLSVVCGIGALGTWMAMAWIDWAFRGAMFLGRWKSGKWEKKRVV